MHVNSDISFTPQKRIVSHFSFLNHCVLCKKRQEGSLSTGGNTSQDVSMTARETREVKIE